MERNKDQGRAKQPLRLVLGIMGVLFAIVFVAQNFSGNQDCLIDKSLFDSQQTASYETEFSKYTGTKEAASWTDFSQSLKSYLSEAYRSCISADTETRACVREGLDEVQNILRNESRDTPRERWEAFLALNPPRFCAQQTKRDKDFESQRKLWESANMGDLRKARTLIKSMPQVETATTVDPGASPVSPRVSYNLGLINYLDAKNEEARVLLAKSLDLDSKNFKAHYVKALIDIRAQDFEAALTQLKRASAELSQDPSAAFITGVKIEWATSVALRGLRRFEDADNALEALIQKVIRKLGENHPLLGQLYLEQAWVRSDRRGYGQAQKILRKTFRIWKGHYDDNHPRMLDAHIAMGLAQVEGDLAEEAIQTLQKAQAINENLGNELQRKLEIQFILALAYADRDRYLDRALELAGRTLYELRSSDVKLPYLEIRIQRWLEAL